MDINPPDHLDDHVAAVWRDVIARHDDPGRIVGPELDAYCGQIALQRDARSRIAREGVIIDDGRGNPMPHPAIAIEAKAQSEIRLWGNRFR